MGVSDEADRTLFVGNLDPQVTEELLFELFLQAGPLIKVKIPKDNDGRMKQFAFVNYKHEVSVPYGMELLNGTKLFGRALKIQFRSGSSHMNQEGKNPSPSNTPGRYDRPDQTGSPLFSTPPQMQRSFSSPDSLQRQALMNNMWQLQMHQLQQLNGAFPMGFPPAFGGAAGGAAGVGGGGGGGGAGLAGESPWQLESQSSRGHRQSHQQDSGGGHQGRDQRYSDAGPERHRRDYAQRSDFHHHDDRSGGRNRDYPDRRRDQREGSRDAPRDGRYRRY